MAIKDDTTKASSSRKMQRPLVLVICVVVALIVGIACDHFILSGLFGGSVSFSGQTAVPESDLDKVLASYTYKGKTEKITVRNAIESQTSLESSKKDDGTYKLPSADTALSVARNKILGQIAADQGITVSDDDISAYAESLTGSSDISTIASQYNLKEDQAKEIIRESAVMSKLKDQVVGAQSVTAPVAPTKSADVTSDNQATADYGAYIVNLLGDEWDSSNNTWARTDGPYYTALSSESFSANSATYDQALRAYYVAYQQYSTNANSQTAKWTDYSNGILSDANIQIFTLTA